MAQRAGDNRIGVDVVEGKSYFWCTCGKSLKQPFCDGSHKGTEFTGHDLPIKCIFNSRDHGFSTSELRQRIYLAEKEKI